jgi:hypothetical protein
MRKRSVVRAMHEVVSGGRTARGKTKGKIGCHGSKVESERPRLRSFERREQAVLNWQAMVAEVGLVRTMNVQQRAEHSLVLIFDKYFTSSLWIVVSTF